MYNLAYFKMSELPEHWKPRLRELSFGADEGTMHRWTFHEGRCYAAVLRYNKRIVAWSCITFCEDTFPVVGCYTEKTQRKKGLGKFVSEFMLECADLERGSCVYAVAENWAAWPSILASFGLHHFEWE